jgi:hypothetical protein
MMRMTFLAHIPPGAADCLLAFTGPGDFFGMMFVVLIVVILAVYAAVLVTNVHKGMREETWKVRRQSGECLNCGYKLRGNLSGVCPECGTPATAVPPNAIPKGQPAPFLLSSWSGGRPMTPADLLEESRSLAERNVRLSRDNSRLAEEVGRLASEYQELHARSEAVRTELRRLRYGNAGAGPGGESCKDCEAPMPASAAYCPRCGRRQQTGAAQKA